MENHGQQKINITLIILTIIVAIIIAGFYYFNSLADKDNNIQPSFTNNLPASTSESPEQENIDYSALENTAATLLVKQLAKDVLKIDQADLILDNTKVIWNTADSKLTIPAKGVSVAASHQVETNIINQHLDLLYYFKNQGYIADTYNIGSGSPEYDFSSMRKDDTVCNLIIKTKQDLTTIELACAELPK